MKFRKEIDPNATWQDWINSQGRFKKAQNPKRAAGDSKIRPEIAEINPVEAILESLGIKKFQRKASKKSLVSAVGSPSKEGDNEFYAVRKRIEGLENGQKGMATFLTKTQSLLGGATGAAGSISNVGGMMQSPQGMASLAQVMFGGVANTLTTVGNPDTIKSVSKTMGGLARSVSSTLSIGNGRVHRCKHAKHVKRRDGQDHIHILKIANHRDRCNCGNSCIHGSSKCTSGIIQSRRNQRHKIKANGRRSQLDWG